MEVLDKNIIDVKDIKKDKELQSIISNDNLVKFKKLDYDFNSLIFIKNKTQSYESEVYLDFLNLVYLGNKKKTFKIFKWLIDEIKLDPFHSQGYISYINGEKNKPTTLVDTIILDDNLKVFKFLFEKDFIKDTTNLPDFLDGKEKISIFIKPYEDKVIEVYRKEKKEQLNKIETEWSKLDYDLPEIKTFFNPFLAMATGCPFDITSFDNYLIKKHGDYIDLGLSTTKFIDKQYGSDLNNILFMVDDMLSINYTSYQDVKDLVEN